MTTSRQSLPRRVKDFLSSVRHPHGAARAYLPLTGSQILWTVGTCAAGYLAAPSLAPLFLGVSAAAVAVKLGIAHYDRNQVPQGVFRDGRHNRGIFFLGSEKANGRAVWLTDDQVRQHSLVLGAIGSGRNEALLAMAENAIHWNSGFLFVDGQGDVDQFVKVHAMARTAGREDDLAVLNFLGTRLHPDIQSNTYNPLAKADSETVANILISMLPPLEPLLLEQATLMLDGLSEILVWQRDEKGITLDIETVRDALPFEQIVQLCDPANALDMPDHVRTPLSDHLDSLPGYEKSRGHRQPQLVIDQHTRLEVGLRRRLGGLAERFGHVLLGGTSEFDMTEAFLNRRIVVVLLPPDLGGSEDIATLVGMIVAGLGNTFANILTPHLIEWETIISHRPSKSPSPFLTILSGIERHIPSSMDLIHAQARSLGVGMIFGASRIDKKLKDGRWGGIIANTNTKIVMRLEDEEGCDDLLKDGDKTRPSRLEAGGMILTHHGQTMEMTSSFPHSTRTRWDGVGPNHFIAIEHQGEAQ